MTHPSVLIASPIRYRPECPEVLDQFLEALPRLEWPGKRGYYFALHCDPGEGYETENALRKVTNCWQRFDIQGSADSRYMIGPRGTGEVQENIAFLRNKILRRFQEGTEDLLLMVDSDVILRPEALLEMAGQLARVGQLATVSLQIDNRLQEDYLPHANAFGFGERGEACRVEWQTDGRLTEVRYSGACTLYPRAILYESVRFGWAPGYSEEHQSLYDGLRERGWRHYLYQRPELADHRMKRMPSSVDLARQVFGGKK